MRILVYLAMLVGACVPSHVTQLAGDRLGVHGKHLHLVGYDRIDGSDVYTYCRSESRTGWFGGGRTYDGACVTLICPADDDGRHCG